MNNDAEISLNFMKPLHSSLSHNKKMKNDVAQNVAKMPCGRSKMNERA